MKTIFLAVLIANTGGGIGYGGTQSTQVVDDERACHAIVETWKSPANVERLKQRFNPVITAPEVDGYCTKIVYGEEGDLIPQKP